MSWLKKLVQKAIDGVKNDVKKVETAANNDLHAVVNDIKKGETAIAHGVKNTVRKLGKNFEKLGKDLEALPLLPFVPPMQLLLKSHGQPYKGSTFDIAQRFFSYFIAGSKENFENFDEKDTLGSSAGAVALGAAGQAVGIPAPVGAAIGKIAGTLDEKAIKLIISAILKFFKKHKGTGSAVDKALQVSTPLSNQLANILNGGAADGTNLGKAASDIADNHFGNQYQNLFHGAN